MNRKIDTWIFLAIFTLYFSNVAGQKNNFYGKYCIPIASGTLGVSWGAALLLAPETYSPRFHTISQLGAQHYKYAPVMNSGFITHGALVGLKSAHDLIKGNGHWTTNVPLLIYGSSLTMLGFYHTVPFEKGIPYAQREANVHGILAVTAVAGLTGTILANLVCEKNRKKLPLHIAGLGAVAISSSLLLTDKQRKGFWESALLMSGICWMTINYSVRF
jgi:hypothetical protein